MDTMDPWINFNMFGLFCPLLSVEMENQLTMFTSGKKECLFGPDHLTKNVKVCFGRRKT